MHRVHATALTVNLPKGLHVAQRLATLAHRPTGDRDELAKSQRTVLKELFGYVGAGHAAILFAAIAASSPKLSAGRATAASTRALNDGCDSVPP